MMWRICNGCPSANFVPKTSDYTPSVVPCNKSSIILHGFTLLYNMDINTLYTYFEACSQVTTDTRKLEKDSMFFALKGASFNGNTFAKQAIENGCRYAVIDEEAYLD